ncbi:MAG TPA: AmmeMemoRadiSam system protein A [Methylophilus sp.]|nr:AmmeMemoRadiSam system protein A [Methylophilus sp.]HQQ32676.1 AmmeMemoRadiSam system protein A [Methylophilus sp.]
MPEETNKLKSIGTILLPIARKAISEPLGIQSMNVAEDAAWLHEIGASFITLTQNQQLRGCIGSLEAHRSLISDVKANAFAAAFHDPRFRPLKAAELDFTEIEVSLLTEAEAMQYSSEQEALAQLQPGQDGVIFQFGAYRSTFLPQVWDQLPDAITFMAHLKQKAGLYPTFWHDEVKLYRYSVRKWKERDNKMHVEVGSTRA